jgi:hypothetical protein
MVSVVPRIVVACAPWPYCLYDSASFNESYIRLMLARHGEPAATRA